MDERGLNIDVIFRNGLKDYEVLPPSDVWENIAPLIRKRQRSFMVFRAAALIAIMLSLGFLAYRWSREVTSGSQEIMADQNDNSVNPPSTAMNVIQPAREVRKEPVHPAASSVPVFDTYVSETSGTDHTIRRAEDPAVSEVTAPEDRSGDKYNKLEINNYTSGTVNSALYTPVYENTEQTRAGRWSISALVTPSYHSRLKSGNNEAVAGMMTSEKPVISYSGGLALSYRISKRFSVQSGLYYSNIGNELSGITAYSGFLPYGNAKGGTNFDVITENGTVKTSNPDVYLLDAYKRERVITPYTSNNLDPAKSEMNYVGGALRQDFSYLELPVMVRYKLVDKTLGINIIGGISSNLLVNNRVSVESVKYKVGETEGLNNITFSSSLGMGMEYNFTGKLSLNLEPTFRYYLNPFGSIAGITVHPFSFGIFSGLSYKF